MTRIPQPSEPKSAFTLVELLVSMAVLVMLVVLVARLMSSATLITTQSGKRMDSDTQIRVIFDRMASDFSGLVKRQDADYIFAKQAGNDTMYFFTEGSAYFDSSVGDGAKSSASLVGYRVNSSFQLERLSRGLTWDGTPTPSPSPGSPGSIMFLTPSGSSNPVSGSTIAGNWTSLVGSPPSYSNGTGADYHVIGDQVYRLEVSFLQTNGTVSSSVASYNGLQNVSAIVVALGMLDTTSRVILLQNGQIPTSTGNNMIAVLPDSVDGTPTLQTWKASTYLTASGISQASAAQLRIYERAFYLTK
jgi:prepilin-type N-terminal cleavage/methylation domain-containing protein